MSKSSPSGFSGFFLIYLTCTGPLMYRHIPNPIYLYHSQSETRHFTCAIPTLPNAMPSKTMQKISVLTTTLYTFPFLCAETFLSHINVATTQPGFSLWLCRDLNIYVTLSSTKADSTSHPFEKVAKTNEYKRLLEANLQLD